MTGSDLLGIVFLMLSGMGGLIYSLRREKKRLNVQKEWIHRVSFIRRQIDCYLSPLDEIMGSLGFADGKNALQRLIQDTSPYLNTEERRLLSSFSENIGKGYREEQLRLCTDTLNGLEDLYVQQSTEHPKRVRVLTAVWISLPLGIAILLW